MTASDWGWDWDPYRSGEKLKIRAHVPPDPTPVCIALSREAGLEMDAMTPLQRVLRYRRLPGGPVPSDESTLEIVEPIVTGMGRFGQVVKVLAPGITGDRPVAAKFYDPAFGDESLEVDPIPYADRAYMRETRTFRKLSSLQGSIIPRYFGSYTCDFRFSEGTHTVRLILMEFIDGINLLPYDLPAPEIQAALPQCSRKNILAKLVFAESLVFANGILHRDLDLRNVMVDCKATASFSLPDLRLVLIDFGSSEEFTLEENRHTRHGLPVSPIHRWHVNSSRFPRVKDWVDWDWQPWIEQTFRDNNMFAPVVGEFRGGW